MFSDETRDRLTNLFVDAGHCRATVVHIPKTGGQPRGGDVALSKDEAERLVSVPRATLDADDLSTRTRFELAVRCAAPAAAISARLRKAAPPASLPDGECEGSTFLIEYNRPKHLARAEAFFSRDPSTWSPETAALLTELRDTLAEIVARMPPDTSR